MISNCEPVCKVVPLGGMENVVKGADLSGRWEFCFEHVECEVPGGHSCWNVQYRIWSLEGISWQETSICG